MKDGHARSSMERGTLVGVPAPMPIMQYRGQPLSSCKVVSSLNYSRRLHCPKGLEVVRARSRVAKRGGGAAVGVGTQGPETAPGRCGVQERWRGGHLNEGARRCGGRWKNGVCDHTLQRPVARHRGHDAARLRRATWRRVAVVSRLRAGEHPDSTRCGLMRVAIDVRIPFRLVRGSRGRWRDLQYTAILRNAPFGCFMQDRHRICAAFVTGRGAVYSGGQCRGDEGEGWGSASLHAAC